ncbi:MAG: TolC family protein [Lentisphaeria bacterium]|nr:TolC family protein [Lentisphaeria bacterium]
MALRPFVLFPLLFLAACAEYPSDRYRGLADFRKEFPSADPAPLAGKKRLTLAEVRRTALANNPDYLSAHQSVAAAKYRYYRSLSAYLPQADFRAGVLHSLRNSHDLLNPPAGVMPQENLLVSDLGLRASLLLFDGLAREFAMLAARQEERRSRALDRNARRLLVRAVAYAYYDAVLAEETRRIAEADLAFQLSSLRQAENQYRNGLVSKAAVLNFRILANSARSAILNARYRGEVARNSLGALMGYPDRDLPAELELSPPGSEADGLYRSLGSCLEQAAANRPDLRAAALMLDIALFRKWRAFSEFLPTVRAETGLDFSTGNSRYGGYRVDRSRHNTTDFNWGIAGEWNLFRGFASVNQFRERMAEQEIARLQLSEQFLRVLTEVRDAWANYRNAREQVRLCRETLQWVYEQRALVRSAFWCGRDTITRLNGAQSDVVEAECRLAIARIETAKALIQLRAAVGMEE